MVVIAVEEGKLRGKIGEDIRGGKFYSFQGIPYAAPPVGKLRFKAPRPPLPWLDIREATKEGDESLSKHPFSRKIVGSEDCLTLNVYTPDICQNDEAKPLKPVMFWIHGGLFSMGSSKTELYGPEFLVAEDVVLVTINYRLGILGFLSLDDASLGVPGNAGFKDMVMALKWVQKNIVNFCGDPNNVTVFGESAGAASAHLLMLSPMAKGLLHKVIAQSASGLNNWVFGRRSGREMAQRMGFRNTDDRKILEFLQNAPAENLLQTQLKIDAVEFMEEKPLPYGVVVERPSAEEAFLTEHPIHILLSGNYNQVPLIMGYNSADGMVIDVIINPKSKAEHFYNLETSVPLSMNLLRGSSTSKALADKLKRFYYGDVGKLTRDKHLHNFYNLVTDSSFLRGVYTSVKHHAAISKHPVYMYRMSVETELNLFKKSAGVTLPGVFHADDLGYLFKSALTPHIEPGSIEDISQRRFTKMWANFARYSNPTPDREDGLFNVEWKPVEKDAVYFLDIGRELSMQVNPEPERMALWDELFQTNPMTSKL